jgi:hypothetical protein
MEAVESFEKSVNFHQTSRRNIPDHSHRCEKLNITTTLFLRARDIASELGLLLIRPLSYSQKFTRKLNISQLGKLWTSIDERTEFPPPSILAPP